MMDTDNAKCNKVILGIPTSRLAGNDSVNHLTYVRANCALDEKQCKGKFLKRQRFHPLHFYAIW